MMQHKAHFLFVPVPGVALGYSVLRQGCACRMEQTEQYRTGGIMHLSSAQTGRTHQQQIFVQGRVTSTPWRSAPRGQGSSHMPASTPQGTR